MLLLLAPTSAPQLSYPCKSSSQVCKHKRVTNFLFGYECVSVSDYERTSARTAALCVGLQHTATTATHCNTLQPTTTQCVPTSAPQLSQLHFVFDCNTLQHTATHCNTLQHTATHSNTLQPTTKLSTYEHTSAAPSLQIE